MHQLNYRSQKRCKGWKLSWNFTSIFLFISHPHYWISQMALKLRITKFTVYSTRNISTLVKSIRKVFATPSSCSLVSYPRTYNHDNNARDIPTPTQHISKTISELHHLYHMTFNTMKTYHGVEGGEEWRELWENISCLQKLGITRKKELKREDQIPSFIKNKKI